MGEDKLAEELLRLRKDFIIAKRNVTWLSFNVEMRLNSDADAPSSNMEIVYVVHLAVDKGDQVHIRSTNLGFALEEAYRRAEFDARMDVR